VCHYRHMIWVPESHCQNCNQGWDICQVDALVGDIGLNL
jgi:Na+-translocating ferredoxin:NAD+ oxidoreductase RNF subunit RnfB